MTALLIPITLDALMVRPGPAEPWAATKMAQPTTAGTTRQRQQLTPDPFQALTGGRPPGAYLHWALPDALGRGVQNDAGTTTFPTVPNRWIVLRLSGPATPGGRRVDGWMLPDISTAVPVTVADFLTAGPPGAAPTPAQPLTVLGHGDPSWAAYFDNVLGRLAFYDDLATAATGPVSYLVCGWYLDPAQDPLPRTTETALRAYLERQQWQADLPAGALPTQSLFHGAAVSIGWPDPHWTGDGGRLGEEPDLRPDAAGVEVAAGVTLADALAVFTASPDEVALARLMTGLLSGALDRLTSADGPARLDTVLHADRFGSVPAAAGSETIWEAPVTGGPDGKFQPVKTAAPRSWHPADPALVLRGAGRSFRHGGDGRFADTGALDCRVEGGTVTAFGVAGGNPGDGAAVLPADRLAALAARTPAACAALLVELAALDPGSAPDLDQATATQPSPVAAARAAWWATWEPGAGPLDGAVVAGTLPSPLAVTPPTRPWTPLHLEWRADYFPSRLGHHDWDLSDLDYEPAPGGDVTDQPTHHLSGRILLTAAGAGVTAEIVPALADQDLLSGSLDHLSEQLRGDSTDALVQAPGASAVPLPGTPLPANFVGLRAGALGLTALRVVDGYGRTLDLPPAPIPSTDAGFPVRHGALALPPRFTAPARMLLRYTDATGAPLDADSGRTPVCGYLVPSPVDGTMEFFGADAGGLGRLRPDPVTGVAWEPDPGRPANAGARPGADIANPFLAAIAESLLDADLAAALGGAGATETVLNGVQQVMDTTRWTVDLTGRTGDEHLALLLGAPVAVLRAAILLEVDDPRQPAGLAANAVEVKLGTLAHQQDGLLGYYIGDDYRHMRVVDPAVRDAVVGTFADAYLADPAFTVQPGIPVTLTLLTVPGTDVHVTAGLVPQKAVGQLREWTAPALAHLSPALRFGPVLRDPAATRLPYPSDIRGTWTWHRRPGPGAWASDTVVRATADALLPPARPEASDGWLQVALLPDNLYRDTATRIGIDRIRTRRGPRGRRGAILAVGTGDRALLTVAEAARLQESGRFAFHVAPTGAEVHVITDASGEKSLHTSLNPSDPNGLATLPEADGIVDRLSPATATQGAAVHVILRGTGLAGVTDVTFTDPGIEVTSVLAGETWVDVAITVDPEVTPGPQTLTVFTEDGAADASRVTFEILAAAANVTRWTAGTRSNSWVTAGNWSAGVPTATSIAVIDTPATIFAPATPIQLRGLIVDSTAFVSISNLTVESLELHAQASLSSISATVTDAFTWTGGTHTGGLILSPRSATRIEGADAKQIVGSQGSGVFMHGTVVWDGAAPFTLSSLNSLDGLLVVTGQANLTGGAQLRNQGVIELTAGSSLTFAGARLDHRGTVQLSGGSVRFQRDQHNWRDGAVFAGTGSVQITDPAAIFTDAGNLTIESGVTVQLTSGSINGALVVEGGGTLNWSGGAISSVPIEFRPGTHIVLDTTAVKTLSGQMIVRGDLTWRAGTLQLSGLNTLVNEGRLDVLATVACTGNGTIVNNGILTVADGAALNITATLDHSGTLELDNGTIDLQQGNSRWRPRSRVTGAGTVQVHSPAVLTGEGRVDTEPGITVQVLTGTVNGVGFVLAGGATVAWQGGTMGFGPIELAPDCPLVVDGPAAKALTATLTVRSATTVGGGGAIQISGALINEGRLTVLSTTPITGTGTITNSGTIALAPATGLTTTVGITHAGTIELGGGTVDLQNGTHTWTGSSRIAGTGVVRVLSPATLTTGTAGAAATITPGVTVQLVSGTVNAPFVLQGGGTLAWLGGTIAGFGTVVEARADCPVLVDGPAARTLNAAFVVRGVTTWKGGATVQIGGTLINHGSLTLQSTAQFTGTGTVRNFGAVALDPAVGLTMAGPILDNAGTVRLSGGTLTLQSATHTWRDGSAFDGTGTVSLASGSVGATGRVNAAGGINVQLDGGTLTGGLALDGGGTFTWLSGTVGSGLVDVHPACPVVFDGTGAKTVTGGGLVIRGASTWRGGGPLQLSGPLVNSGTLTVQASAQVTGTSTLTNKGAVVLADGVTVTMAGPALDHQGRVQFAGGGLVLQAGSHNWRDDAVLTGTGQLTLTTVTGTPPTLTANGHLAIGAGAGLTVNAGTLGGIGTVEGGGTVTWNGGTISATLEVDPGCPVRITGTTARTLSGSLTVQGDTTWSDGGSLQLTGVLTNQGTLAVQTTAQCTGTNKLVNKGTIRLAEGAGLTMAGPDLTQTGVVQLAGGTLALQGTGHHLGDGCRFTGAGTVQLSGAATMFLDSHLVIAPGVTLQLVAGTVSGTCAVEGGGTVVWSGGTITGNTVDFRADCPVVINTTAAKSASGNVVLRGATTWTDGGTLAISSGGLVIEGTLDLRAAVQCTGTGTGTLTNRGRLTLAEGVGLTMTGSGLTQSGVLELAGGTVTLQSGTSRLDDGSRLTGSGTVLVAGTASLVGDAHITTSPGIIIRVSAGTFTGAAFEGGGSLSWTGGTINGTLDVRPECAVTISGGGTRTLNGPLTVRGATTWTDGGTLQQGGSGSLTNEGVITIAADVQINGMSVNNRGAIALTGGAGLALSGALLDHSGSLDLTGGALSLTGQQHTWREGAAITGAGQVTVNAATTLTGTGRLTLGPGVGIVVDAGTLSGSNNTCIIEGGGTVQLIGGQISGVEIRPDSILVINGTAAKALSNSTLRGVTTWSEGGTVQINGNVTHEGVLTVTDDAQATGAGALINRGTVALADGVDLAFNGPAFDHFGDLKLAGGTLDIQKSGGHNWRSAATFTGAGTVRVQGPATVTAGGHVAAEPGVTVQLAGGTVNGTLTFEGGGTFAWLGGSMAVAEFRPGCPVRLDGDAAKTLNGNVILRGDTTWTGTGALVNGGGRTLTLAGRLEIQSTVQSTGFSNLINRGVIALGPGVVWTVNGPVLASSGTLELNTGTLQLGAGAHTLVGRSELDTILETPEEFGRIVATGSLALTGVLAVDPGTDAPFTVVTAAPLTGSFTDVTSTEGDWTATYTATAATARPVS